jgi:hypothetical protein
MQLFKDVLKQAGMDTIDHLGQLIYIRGIQFSAIFIDEEFEGEAGFKRVVSITISANDAAKVMKGDQVIVDGSSFSLKNIPNTSDSLVEIELKRA